MKNIIIILLLGQFSIYASVKNECKTTLNIYVMAKCENIVLDKIKKKMEKDINAISRKLADMDKLQKTSSKANFQRLQNQWLKFVDLQCKQETLLWGEGSMRILSPITCKEYLYKQRIQYFKDSYEDILSID